MRDYFDSSAFVAAVSEDDIAHKVALAAWKAAKPVMVAHGLLEAFSILSGSRHPARLSPHEAATIIAGNIAGSGAEVVSFSAGETMDLLRGTQASGVRGGSVYDFLHVCAARKATVDRIVTLNKRHFTAIAPDLALKIFHPEEL